MDAISTHFDWAMAFLAVAELGGFTKASDALGCTKAHVSKQVALLEKALGVQLLYRTTRRLSLTEAGMTYAAYCRQLRSTMLSAEHAVSGLRAEVSGLVKITAPTTFGAVFMGELIVAFKARYPAIQVELDLSLGFRDLEAEGFDLAIRSSPSQNERLIAKLVGVRRDWLVAAPALVTRMGAPDSPEQLAQLPCIVNSHFKDPARWHFIQQERAITVDVQNWLRANDYPIIRQFCMDGLGFACLPRYQIEPDVVAGKLQRVLSEYELPSFSIYLVYPQRLPQPAKVRALIDFVTEWFTQPGRQMVRW